jgi:hypothetical protein
MAAFDIAPHKVGNSRALEDDIHPWDLLRRTHATALSGTIILAQLGVFPAQPGD